MAHSGVSPSLSSMAAPQATGHGGGNSSNVLRKYYQTEYPKEIWWFFGALIALLTAARLVSTVIAFVRRWRFHSRSLSHSVSVSEKDTESGGARTAPFPIALRVPLALVNAWKIVWFRSTIHFGFGYSLNVAEVVLTCAYIVALFTWSFVHTQNLTMNWWANRTGALAAAQFPLVTALGTKNNVISWLTGIGHEKLNYLHRMTARVSLVLLWVHGGARLSIMSRSGNHEDWSEPWFRAGFVATVFLSALVLVSVRPVRERRYEFFVWFHFAVVLIFTVGGYFHVKRFAYTPYLWPCFLIWGLDRFLRLARLAFFSFSSFLSSYTSEAEVRKLSPHLLRVRVPRPRGFHWAPGQTAYLVFPGVSTLPCEAHPFTIGSADPSATTDLPSLPSPSSGGEEGDDLVFFIGVQTGFTKKLAARVDNANGVARVRALVDGPYGHGADLVRSGGYDNAVLVAGGTGLAWGVPVFVDAVRRAKEMEGKARLRRIVFVWAIRERSHITWIAPTLQSTLSLARTVPNLSVSVRVYVTAPSESWDDDSVHSGRSGHENEKEMDIEGVEILSGRPDLGETMREEMARGGREMFVGVCGSASLAGAVKEAARVNPLWGQGSVVRGAPSVELVVESFGYA
ncbi:hypothetical protein OE88DRAFT_1686164 [Heliocybe sulcata]|uniref:FAD-binding FR-type domain-containing protein n=1 Tax=Heliocybe sulcata TaxID=5364 RepID=A0A5C3MR50_9AGAM|nr:hypothetical protein OE88DRAFT_1686164 [Heliocybe sulcata]